MLRLEQISTHLQLSPAKQITYAVPVTSKRKGQSPIYRHPKAVDGLCHPPPQIKNLADFWDETVKKHPNHKLIEDYTYNQVDEFVKKAGTWFLKNQHEKIYLYCKNSPQWTITDLAAWNYGLITVPLYDTLGDEAFDHILKLTEGTVITSNGAMGETMISNLERQRGKITTIIIFDNNLSKAHEQKLTKMGFKVLQFWQDIIKKTNTILPRPKMNLQSHLTYSFTSGTTGIPKGVIGTHLNTISQVLAMNGHFIYKDTDIHMSYLPIAHTFERFVIWSCVYYATNIRYSKFPPTQILKDLAQIKPTTIPIVPRLLNKLYSVMKQMYEKEGQASKKKIIGLFGGRLQRMVTGSAPVSPEILSFFRKTLDCDIREGYGQTETTAATFITYEGDDNYGHVGGINKSVEFKLVDVPEMNYTSDQNPPKGEVCVRGHSVFVGYYKDSKNTNQTLDADNFNHSGDIGVILPNGALKIIDRKKNIYKLSQGEYVAPEKVENIYMRCKFVAECFLYGDSLRDYNVAVIHPNLDALPAIAQNLGIAEKDPIKLCSNDKVVKFIQDELNKQAAHDKLLGFQTAKKIKLSPQSFATVGAFTSTMKLQRAVAKNAFMKDIEKMYQS